jgi:hypothetical protein
VAELLLLHSLLSSAEFTPLLEQYFGTLGGMLQLAGATGPFGPFSNLHCSRNKLSTTSARSSAMSVAFVSGFAGSSIEA